MHTFYTNNFSKYLTQIGYRLMIAQVKEQENAKLSCILLEQNGYVKRTTVSGPLSLC